MAVPFSLSAVRIRPSTIAALGVALAYGAGFWLVLLHHAEGATSAPSRGCEATAAAVLTRAVLPAKSVG